VLQLYSIQFLPRRLFGMVKRCFTAGGLIRLSTLPGTRRMQCLEVVLPGSRILPDIDKPFAYKRDDSSGVGPGLSSLGAERWEIIVPLPNQCTPLEHMYDPERRKWSPSLVKC
jgi:hypothetical protein